MPNLYRDLNVTDNNLHCMTCEHFYQANNFVIVQRKFSLASADNKQGILFRNTSKIDIIIWCAIINFVLNNPQVLYIIAGYQTCISSPNK